jgi:hypothetical protein
MTENKWQQAYDDIIQRRAIGDYIDPSMIATLRQCAPLGPDGLLPSEFALLEKLEIIILGEENKENDGDQNGE